MPVSICDDVEDINTCWTSQEIIEEHSQPNIISGEAEISDFVKDGTKSQFSISATTDSVIELPHLYYPGFVVTLTDQDGNTVELQKNVSEHGFIQVSISAGFVGTVSVRYGISIATGVGAAISGATIVSTITASIIRRKKNKKIITKRRKSRLVSAKKAF